MAELGCAIVRVIVKILVFLPVALIAVVMGIFEVVGKSRKEYWKQILWTLGGSLWSDALTIQLAMFKETYQTTINSFNVEKKIALTIDDAPGDDPEMMIQVLDLLKAEAVKVTFFCTTDFIKNPGMDEVMARMVEDGHQLANHMPEDKPYHKVSAEEFEEQLLLSSEAIKTFTGDLPSIWRAPSGRLNKSMAQIVAKNGMTPILGDVFSADPWVGGNFKEPSPSCVSFHVNYMLRHTHGGSVIIVHSANKENRRQLLPILEELLPKLKEKGLEFGTVSELMPSL